MQIVVTTRLVHAEAGVMQSASELPGAFLDAVRLMHAENAAESEAFDKASAAMVMLK